MRWLALALVALMLSAGCEPGDPEPNEASEVSGEEIQDLGTGEARDFAEEVVSDLLEVEEDSDTETLDIGVDGGRPEACDEEYSAFHCPGHMTCEEGVVTVWKHTLVECWYWVGSCPVDYTVECQEGCGLKERPTPYGDPYDLCQENQCQDVRQLGDGKLPDDTCWDPPEHYCSDGGGDAFTSACSPDGANCCTFGTTCIPCGWTDCTWGSGDCPEVPEGGFSNDNSECQAVMPDTELVICWDEVEG